MSGNYHDKIPQGKEHRLVEDAEPFEGQEHAAVLVGCGDRGIRVERAVGRTGRAPTAEDHPTMVGVSLTT
jgi:hypothetical protein